LKQLIIILLIFCTPWTIYGQNEANWWFFGAFAGIDFNAGAPVATTAGQLDTTEGCASIANPCGMLLFYTDGITVWDSAHQVMQNGNGLLGDPSSTQSAIVIPQPGNNDRYFVFTVGDVMPQTGLNYSVVDMTLNGGLGAVLPGEKNINLLMDSTEKVTAAVNAAGDSAWILSYAESVPGSANFNSFYAFKLTASGMDLSATVQSTFNNVQTTDRRGYLRVSPDGGAIAMMTQQFVDATNVNETARGAWFFSFNSTTGRVFNPLRLEFPGNLHAYGTEFSPDNSKIYIDLNTAQSGFDGERTLVQYDRGISGFATQPSTVYQTDVNNPNDNVSRGGMQLGPDGIIYYTRKNTIWLSTITNPNAAAAAASFALDGFRVAAGTTVQEGLPPFYNAFFNPSFQFVEGCVGNRTLFNADAIASCPGSTVLWDFGNPTSGTANTATVPNPSHVYTNTGTYTVTLTITTIRCVYTSNKDVTISQSPLVHNIMPISLCDDDGTNDGIVTLQNTAILATALGAQDPANIQATVHSNPQDANTDFNALPPTFNASTGTYYVRLDTRSSNGCYEVIPFTVTITAIPVAFAVSDLITCDDFSNDGFELFDLTVAGDEALGTQNQQDVQLSYYRSLNDATGNRNPLPNFYSNTAANEQIFIRLQSSSNTDCFATTFVNLRVVYQAVIPLLEDLTTCDEGARDHTETFNLAALNAQITNVQPGNLSLSYHATEQDALNDRNALLQQYNNTAATQTIWVRLASVDRITCADVQPLNLIVYPKPSVSLPADFIKCAKEQVLLPATPGFEHYLWNTLESTANITVVDAGTYTVTVTDINGCTDTKSLIVKTYEPTRIITVAVDQFTIRTNRIEITATGSGPFEYSLDSFIYQDSPVFANLLPGFYTIYVRDKNGCDLVTAPATIIAARNFFTPNGDGFHDYWQVIAIETEPDAKIYIFDRFGKLLKQLDPLGPGWDGTYSNNPMPSSDYWFLVALSDGQSFKGHFTLKR
jgi:gliding motility-associated-like protein